MMIRFLLGILLAVLLFVPVGRAQQPPGSATDQAALAYETPSPSGPSQPQTADLEKRVAAAESEVKEQKAQNAELKAAVEQLKGRMDESDHADETALIGMGEEEFKQRLEIYGFMDAAFYYYDFEKKTITASLSPSDPSFSVNHVNLYFSGQMERTLSALAEIQYTFLPNGKDKTFAVLGNKYSATDTTVMSPYDWGRFPTHSLAIERAIVTWKPYDFLGITVGRFITPFGIWVTDHAPTVTIPARLPYLIVSSALPLSQTGLQLFGRLFPFANSYFDYALTLSNGRGPGEALFDLDNNKAIGLRLKGSYETKHFDASVGGYIYSGMYTNVTKGTKPNATAEEALVIVVNPSERYKELSGALDLTIDIYGLRLQGEYCRQMRKYSVRPIIKFAVFDVEDMNGGHAIDAISWYTYGLAAYRIPFKLAGQEMELTPFTLYEYNKIRYSYPKITINGFRFGLNFKPSPFLVVKYESVKMTLDGVETPVTPAMVTRYWFHSGQVAVSF